MTNRSLIRVNQKLAQARELLKASDTESISPIQTDSILEAVAFHLVCAYRHYLRELAEVYSVNHIDDFNNESELVKALQAKAKHPAEADELVNLRTDQYSWLSQLHNYYNSLWKIPATSKAHDHDHDDALIKIVDIDSVNEIPPVTLLVVASWHLSFIDLIRRQRETSAEF